MTDDEVRNVRNTGVMLNIDSLPRLEKFGKEFPGSHICLRFNPDVVDGENRRFVPVVISPNSVSSLRT
uniref:Uncharacterized protein n=1 Tax=Candidatus Kentrum eta TaxID=2126337 RepID=A0A450W0Q4_9GAMM|nr:MAG: hypothetical protein BECKH772B_GA0070898_106482 [Candidatus Kentron sp. H]VFK07294.1 MAG: hypothetical protein BECKH772A_GA0070896_107142 [Candidatus Kentron sp. H]VFK10623.1 MAG: hypothetical protein BECKH772C_GA0070978_107242 [Candidatus Kentron sp. H]